MTEETLSPSPSPEPTPNPSPSPEPTSTTLEPPKSETSLLNVEEPTPVGAPEAYTPFNVGEGKTLDEGVFAEAAPLLKELGLSQEGAQKLVDFYAKQQQAAVDKLYSEFAETRQNWRKETEAYVGTNGRQIKADIGSALNTIFAKPDGTPNAERIGQFRDFMDMTGAGDNPAFVEAFHKMAKLVTEGKAVTGNAPSIHGQASPNAGRPSRAAAIYPNLSQPQSG